MKSRSAADVLRHNTHLVLLTCGLVVMLGLGARELDSVDESLFALRSRAVAEKNAMWDQSVYVPGSVTSTHAPLLVWGTSLLWKPGSTSVFFVRLWPALCSMLALYLLYGISRHMVTAAYSMMVPVVLTGCLLWNDAARSVSASVPAMTLLLAALYSAIRFERPRTRTHDAAWIVAFGVCMCAVFLLDPLTGMTGLALMPFVVSRTRQPTMPMLLLESPRTDRSLRPLMYAGVLGAMASLPPYIHGISQHGASALNDIIRSSTMIGSTAVYSMTSFAVVLRDLLLAQPLFAWGLMSLLVTAARGFATTDENSANSYSSNAVTWRWTMAAVIFVLIPWYAAGRGILLVPVLTLLSLRCLGEGITGRYSSRLHTVTAFLVIAFSVIRLVSHLWHGVPYGHDVVTGGTMSVLDMTLLPMLVAVAYLLSMTVPESMRTRIVVYVRRASTGVLPVLMVLSTAWGNATANSVEKDGAKEVAAWCEQTQTRMMTVLVRSDNAHDTLVSQLAWYSKGWLGFTRHFPWRPAYGCVVLRLQGDATADSVAIMQSIRRDDPIVYMSQDAHPLRERDMRLLEEHSMQRKKAGRYAVYSRIAYSTGGEDEEEE